MKRRYTVTLLETQEHTVLAESVEEAAHYAKRMVEARADSDRPLKLLSVEKQVAPLLMEPQTA